MIRRLIPLAATLLLINSPARPCDCGGTSVGFIPLSDLGENLYLGFQGGLYPDGKNMRPAGHDAQGLGEAAQVVPRDANGSAAGNGKIVLLSIGMSNTTQEFSRFVAIANADPEMNPAPSAEQKVAQALLDFLKVDATAKSWFLRSPTTLCPDRATVANYGTGFGGPNGITRLVAGDLATVPTIRTLAIQAYGAPSNSPGALLYGLAPLPDGQVGLKGGSLLVDFSILVPLGTDGLGQAWFPVGVIPDNPALCDLPVYFQYVVKDPDSPFGHDLSRGLELVVGH